MASSFADLIARAPKPTPVETSIGVVFVRVLSAAAAYRVKEITDDFDSEDAATAIFREILCDAQGQRIADTMEEARTLMNIMSGDDFAEIMNAGKGN